MADINIEQIVAQVLAEMKGAEAPKAAPAPAKWHCGFWRCR